MGLDRFLADSSRGIGRRSNPVLGIECYTRFNLYPPVTMTYQEYNDRRNDIVNAYNNGEMNLPDLQYGLAKLDRDYESTYPVSMVSDWSKRAEEAPDSWTERAEEALAKMKETHRKVKEEWAHAYIGDDDKVKIRNGKMILATMSVLEARLLANEILSITNKQRRK